MKILLLKLIDRVVGPFLIKILPLVYFKKMVVPKRILIIRPGGIGDAILLLPMIQHLAHIYPDAKIEILAEFRNAESFRFSPYVSNIFKYEILSNILKIVNNRYDMVINTEQWYILPSVVARLTGAKIIVGFAGNCRERVLTDIVEYETEKNEKDCFISLIEKLKSIDIEVKEKYFYVPNKSFTKAANLLKIENNRLYVVIFPGASVLEKKWPAECFHKIAKYIVICGFLPVIIGGKYENAFGDIILRDIVGLNLINKTSLSETAAIIAQSSLFIGGDSGMLHIAAMLNVPTISLFGPSDPLKWAPRGDRHIVITKKLPCSPCSRYGTIPTCKHKNICMLLIESEDVTQAIDVLLRKECNPA